MGQMEDHAEPLTSGEDATDSESLAEAHTSLLADMYHTKMWRIYPLMLLYVVSLTMVMPQIPGLMTDFMASRRSGSPVKCENFQPRDRPAACRNAYSDVVWWSTCTAFLSNSVLTFIMSPIIGALSDTAGRRPFLLAGIALGVLPVFVIFGNLTIGTSLLFYYPANILGGAISILSISLAFVADMLPPVHRAAGFGGLMASFSFGILIGPALGSAFTAKTSALAGCVVGFLSALYVFLFIPESLSKESMQKAKAQQNSTDPNTRKATGGLRILMRSSLFRRLTICLMISGVAQEGVGDLFIQYFKLKFDFTVRDVTMVFELFGICGLFVQTIFLRYILKWLGETRVLIVGLLASCLEMVFLTFITAKWQAFGAIFLGSLGGMAFPAISSIKANNVTESEQGSVQGALYGAKALATGTGPLLFAAIFAAFTRTDSRLPFFPGAPFLLGTVIMVAAIAIAFTLDPKAGRHAARIAPLLHSDEEAEVEAEAGIHTTHFADMAAPNAIMLRGDAAAETIEGLVMHRATSNESA